MQYFCQSSFMCFSSLKFAVLSYTTVRTMQIWKGHLWSPVNFLSKKATQVPRLVYAVAVLCVRETAVDIEEALNMVLDVHDCDFSASDFDSDIMLMSSEEEEQMDVDLNASEDKVGQEESDRDGDGADSSDDLSEPLTSSGD